MFRAPRIEPPIKPRSLLGDLADFHRRIPEGGYLRNLDLEFKNTFEGRSFTSLDGLRDVVTPKLIRPEGGGKPYIELVKGDGTSLKLGDGKQTFSERMNTIEDTIKDNPNTNTRQKLKDTLIDDLAGDLSKGIGYGESLTPGFKRSLEKSVSVKETQVQANRMGTDSTRIDSVVKTDPEASNACANRDANSLEANGGRIPEPATKMAEIVKQKVADELGVTKSEIDKLNVSVEDLTKKFEEYSNNATTPGEKSFWDKLKEYGKTLLTIGGLGIAGFFTYEMLSQIGAANSGCFATYYSKSSSGNDQQTCKISSLTCNARDKNPPGEMDFCGGTWMPSTPALPAGFPLYQNVTAGLPSPFTSLSPPPSDQSDICATTIEGTGAAGSLNVKNKDGECSALCSNQFLITSDNNNSYSYQCNNCDFFCSLTAVVKGVTKVVTDIYKVAAGLGAGVGEFFKTIQKYIVYFVIGIIALVILFKVVPFVFSIGSGNSSHFRHKNR